MTTHTQLKFDITWTALNPDDQEYEINTLSVLPGVIEIQNGVISTSIGVVSSDDVIKSKTHENVDMEYLQRMYGGSFMSGFKNVFTKAQKLKPYAKQALKLGKELTPVVSTLAPLLEGLFLLLFFFLLCGLLRVTLLLFSFVSSLESVSDGIVDGYHKVTDL